MATLFFALLLDYCVGDPPWLWRRFPHPVVWLGKVIEWFDAGFNTDPENQEQSVKAGWSIIAMLALSAAGAGWLLHNLLALLGWVGIVVEIVLVAVLLAQKSLLDHVGDVADALQNGGVGAGRKMVAKIVGRDVSQLDESGVSKATIESLAENFSDGIVAPVFWYAVLGFPGLLAYKMINTADSMIGHRDEKYLHFGRGSALVDDVANWIPARVTALLIAAADGWQHRDYSRFGKVWSLAQRDAKLHRSPNAGWPEAAMAAALDVALGGPRNYGKEQVEAPYLYEEGKAKADAVLINRASDLARLMCFALWACAAIGAAIALL